MVFKCERLNEVFKMGILAQRIAQAQQKNVLAYNPTAAMMQEYMLAICAQKSVKANVLNVSEFVNRGHNGENCAFLYMQFCELNNVRCDENILKVLR